MKKQFRNEILKNRKLLFTGAFVLFAFLLPVFLNSFFSSPKYLVKICVFIVIYVIAVSGLDILYGYCGQISMGHAGFFAIGAYGCAIIHDYFNVPILFSVLIAALIAVIIAGIVSYPAANLKFHFLSLATIAFGEIVYSFVQASPNEITGNFRGYFPKQLKMFGINFSASNTLYYYLVLVICLILLVFKRNIIHSKIGRAFISIRENPVAASGMGVNVRLYKVMAFCVSAFYVAVAGALYAHFVNYISPGLFSYDQSVSFMTMLLFGGAGSMFGTIIGVSAIQIINELLRSFDKYQMFMYGILILLVVLFMPNGLIGLKKQIENMNLKVGKKK